MKPIDPTMILTAVHPDDRGLPRAEQTVWRYRPLGVRAQEFVENSYFGLDDVGGQNGRLVQRTGTTGFLRLKLGMLEPEGFSAKWESEPFTALPGSLVVPTDEYLDRIPGHVRAWLSNLIATAAVVKEDDAGNSSPQPTSPSTKGSSPTAPLAAGQATST